MVHIHLETLVRAPVKTTFDLARDIDFHQRSMAHTGERAVGGRTSGLIGAGETVTWQARHLGLRWTLTSRVTEFEPSARFVDEQVSGPFASFRHEHRFEAVPEGTLMVDDWRHTAPLGPLGRVADALVLGRLMTNLLRMRNAALVDEASSVANAEAPVEF
jgi:ligand-binding SRPBCC domain-containing protein